MIRINESHVDHVPQAVVEWALEVFRGKECFDIVTTILPDHLPTLDDALYGPVNGDPPVVEAVYSKRNGRDWHSRLIAKPVRKTREVTIICGPFKEHACVLYTIFGGKATPKEVNDPTLEESDRVDSEEFWAQHALAAG